MDENQNGNENDLIDKSFNDYYFVRQLGDNKFGKKFLAIDNSKKRQVMIKQVSKAQLENQPKFNVLIETEIKILRPCNNQNIVSYLNNFETTEYKYIVTEFCNGKNLQDIIDKKGVFTEEQAIEIIKQVLNGMKGLHQIGAMHRNLKLNNIMFHNKICKIINLGFSRILTNKQMAKTILGCSHTIAPEILSNNSYGIDADIWSIGVLFYQMIYRQYPYKSISDNELLKIIKTSRPDYSAVHISENCQHFIQRCLSVNPIERISWQDIHKHPLFVKNPSSINDFVSNSNYSSENAKFYADNKINPNQGLIYPELKDSDKKSRIKWKKADIQINSKVGPQLKNNSLVRMQIQEKILQFEKIYMLERNKHFYIFKQISTEILIHSLKVNHALRMFFCSKNSYLQLKKLFQDLEKKSNVFKLDPINRQSPFFQAHFKFFTFILNNKIQQIFLNSIQTDFLINYFIVFLNQLFNLYILNVSYDKYWDHFIKSKNYQQVVTQFCSDLEIVQEQAKSYKKNIMTENCNPETQIELDLMSIHTDKWNKFLQEQIQGYWFELAGLLDDKTDEMMKSIIRVLEALTFLLNKPKGDAISWTKIKERIIYQEEKAKIVDKFVKHLKSIK